MILSGWCILHDPSVANAAVLVVTVNRNRVVNLDVFITVKLSCVFDHSKASNLHFCYQHSEELYRLTNLFWCHIKSIALYPLILLDLSDLSS
jgi:hypothetical protein